MPREHPSRSNPEALAALRDRLQATQEAAQRLVDEAAGARTGPHADVGADGDRPPERGWDVPRRAGEAGDELDAVIRVLASLRDVLPPDLRAQLADLARQILAFVRSVLDWWIERMEAEAAAPSDDERVQDIPIT